jgi:hypothetical protein
VDTGMSMWPSDVGSRGISMQGPVLAVYPTTRPRRHVCSVMLHHIVLAREA